MKFYTLLALVASAAAIRVTQVSTPVPNTLMSRPFIFNKITAADCPYDKWIAWLRSEAASDDGLTWDELKTELAKVAGEHGYTPTQTDWDQIKAAFDAADTDDSGSISPSELEAVLDEEK